MAPDPIPRPSPAARTRLSASAPPFNPGGLAVRASEPSNSGHGHGSPSFGAPFQNSTTTTLILSSPIPEVTKSSYPPALMAPDPISRPSPAARSRLSSSAPPFNPGRLAVRASEPSNSGHGAVPTKPSVQAVQNQEPKKYTHFISLQLAIRPGQDDTLGNLKTSILGDDDKRLWFWEYCGIDESIFAKPKTFHLTVLMLELKDKDHVDKASHVLQSTSTEVNNALGHKPMVIQLRGLECIKGSQDEAQVVYAPVLEVSEEGRLALACEVIINAFLKEKLAIEDNVPKDLRVILKNDVRQAKFHATVMNVRFRKSKKRDDSFDARDIFKQYGRKEWGEYLIPRVHLSKRNKFDGSGYYHCCSSIPLPAEMQAE